MTRMSVAVHIWSDVVCPWCYVGLRRLERALGEARVEAELTFHSFELDPERLNERTPKLTAAERLARKYGRTLADAERMIAQMREVGAREGIAFEPSGGRTLQSFDAHRLLHLALDAGRQRALKERLLRAHFEEGQDVGDDAVLAGLAAEVGLDPTRTARVLAGDDYAASVRADERSARELGIRGVPFFLIGPFGLSGAQPPAVLRDALEQARAAG
jgi:predicted DsbA family dithiol-disulfide isomerase